jgi:hypothetical protein
MGGFYMPLFFGFPGPLTPPAQGVTREKVGLDCVGFHDPPDAGLDMGELTEVGTEARLPPLLFP